MTQGVSFAEEYRKFCADAVRKNRWWHCPLCKFQMPDDESVQAALQMGEHVKIHEREVAEVLAPLYELTGTD